MNIFFMMILVFCYLLIAFLLCFVIILQKPEGTIAVANNKKQSSRSENIVLNNLTIILSIIFFTLSLSFNVYSEKVKKSYTIKKINKNL